MNISRIFVERPVMTTLLMLGLLVFGLFSYTLLPINNLPNVDFPTIEVSASLSGASPETMASSVASPLEKEFSAIAGLESITSESTLGSTRITLEFALSRNIDDAALDVQAAISSAMRALPDDMNTPPYFRKVNPAASPILMIAVSSPTLRLSEVTEYAETIMAQRISMVSGVAQVNVYGSQKYAVRIRVDPELVAARGIGLDEVLAAVQRANVNLPTGTVAGPGREYTVRSSGQLMDAEAFRPLVVSYMDGSPVRLGELAVVEDGVESERRANTFDGDPAIILAISRQPGSNTVQIVDDVLRLMPSFRSQIPAAVDLEVMYDRSQTIRESVADVEFTLYLAAVLVVLVIFLFLRTLRATIIPSLALPLSIVGTFAVMYLAGFSLNNISLMALTLSLGFVVDDAIVMLENIVRHKEMGKPTLRAVLDGSREISFTIVSMTVSLAAVFIPVLFMGGIVGRLFNEFAVTISSAILISGLVSLTLTPMLCRLILRDHARARHGALYMAIEHGFEALRRGYEATLDATLRHRALAMALSLAILGFTGWLFVAVPKGFLPSEDQGRVDVSTEAVEGTSFEVMRELQRKVDAIVAADPAVESTMSVVGSGGPNSNTNAGRVMGKLRPLHERDASADEVVARLRPQLADIPGIIAVPRNTPPVRIGGRTTKALYQFTLQNPDTEELYAHAAQFLARMRAMPQIQDVDSTMQLNTPQLRVQIDRDRAAALGVSPRQIENTLAMAYGSREVSTIYAPTNDYKVIMELAPDFQRTPYAVSMLRVRADGGALIPLDAVADLSLDSGPSSVSHTQQMPSVTLSFNLGPGQSLGPTVAAIEALALDTLPPSFNFSFQGTAKAFQDSMAGMWMLLLLSIVVIYIVLGILYESFIHPLTILSGLPSAGAGALLTLAVFGRDLDIYGFVGIIMLVGIVKKNAIMMIDFAIAAQRDQGLTPLEAIRQGALIRFRPIMMTTMAALMGALPIALGIGAGGDARQPLGLAVVGGLLISQVLTLYFTPVYYTYLDAARRRMDPAPREQAG
ncbi:efflux RND transporter permease subunit [Desulfocurvus vexinensis]|uniref:efflux RND transporter permease subunit n=1 Tax=Desulfocurvus vexinensis TaxID=399548 RepID=UPI00048F7DA3|nr:efflux RND transporter permease subunit [Desulfocurvus vexinensis]